MKDELTTSTPAYLDCLRLYIENRGRNVTHIEREMRRLGHARFHRRILYTRTEKGVRKPGWIERYDWKNRRETGKNRQETGDKRRETGDKRRETKERGDRTPVSSLPTPDSRLSSPVSGFRAWLDTVSPTMQWDARHQQIIIDALERITSGESNRLMIFVPPRHGKSELVTVRYAAWRMQRTPSMHTIVASYNQRLADRFSRKMRNVILDSEAIRLGKNEDDPQINTAEISQPEAGSPNSNHCCRQCHRCSSQNLKSEIQDRQCSSVDENTDEHSPFPFTRSRPANRVSEWETATGGSFRAVGVGGGIAGYGADLVIIDDPIKSRAEAESPAFRKRLGNWFNDDLYTRLEPAAAVILIQTRWHEDDLAGRLIREIHDGGEEWEIITLPALSEERRETEDGRRETRDERGEKKVRKGESEKASERKGEEIEHSSPDSSLSSPVSPSPVSALWPERFDVPALEKIKRKLGTYSFSALYQQRPTPAEGGIFKRKWFGRIVDSLPPGLRWARGYDLAVSTDTTASYTASFRCAFAKNGDLYIADGFRDRIEYPDQRRYIIERLTSEPDTIHGIEKALHGHGIIQDIRREKSVRGRPLQGVKIGTDKITRALTWSPLAEEGKVVLVRGPNGSWINDFIDEAAAFPAGSHNDQIDAVSLAVGMLKTPSKMVFGF